MVCSWSPLEGFGVCGAAGKDMVGALGAEVDRLESEIKRVMPGIRHIDLACSLLQIWFHHSLSPGTSSNYSCSMCGCSMVSHSSPGVAAGHMWTPCTGSIAAAVERAVS